MKLKIFNFLRLVTTPSHKAYTFFDDIYTELCCSSVSEDIASIVALIYEIYFFAHNGIGLWSVVVGGFEFLLLWCVIIAVVRIVIIAINYFNKVMFALGNRIYEKADKKIKYEENQIRMEFERKKAEERRLKEQERRRREEEAKEARRQEERRREEAKRREERRREEAKRQEERRRSEQKKNGDSNEKQSGSKNYNNESHKSRGNKESTIKEAMKLYGLCEGFTLQELKKSQKQLLKKYHPDNNPDCVEKSTIMSKKINSAYDALKEIAA
ncbi:MAG: J domain-containing protein [Lachnospiraceae bacterium]|nr:J domain-containing protein [Lachnospiraceae bacterium]